MYSDTINVSNKIISNKDLLDIFQKMNDEIIKNERIYRQEKIQNEKYQLNYQKWTVKDFKGTIKCEFNFYDATRIVIDNYVDIVTVFNNRLHEIKSMFLSYRFNYIIQNDNNNSFISQSIFMYIYEDKIDVEFNLNSNDKKMDDVFQLIKDKFANAEEKYDRVIKKKNSITNKITFALGIIPSMIICLLLILFPGIRHVYGLTFVLYPILSVLFGFVLGGTIFGGNLDRLYSTIIPNKKYDHYDYTNHRSVYKDDINSFVASSEVIIGKNVDNLAHRREILELEKKYSSYIPKELVVLLILSILVVIIGKLL